MRTVQKREKLTKHVRFRVSAFEKNYLERQAATAGISFSELLRNGILERKPIGTTDTMIFDMCETLDEQLHKLSAFFDEFGAESPAYAEQARRGAANAGEALKNLTALTDELRAKPELSGAPDENFLIPPSPAEEMPRTEMVSLRLTEPQYEKLNDEAEEADVPLSDFARDTLSAVFVSRRLDAVILETLVSIRDALAEYSRALLDTRPPAGSPLRAETAETLNSILRAGEPIPDSLQKLTDCVAEAVQRK